MLLAGVLFAVFQQAAGQDQMVMMQQWVLSSLPNFTKRSPVSHSMWCLTVFFFSAAADNCHLQVFFFDNHPKTATIVQKSNVYGVLIPT